MTTPAIFPYRAARPGLGGYGLMPLLPIRLTWGVVGIDADALVDSGSTVNVLPLALGLRLGLVWARAPAAAPLGGAFGSQPTKAVVLDGAVAGFPPARLAFTWTSDPTAPLILGQMNFFVEFDVCFFRSRAEFHVQPRTP